MYLLHPQQHSFDEINAVCVHAFQTYLDREKLHIENMKS